MATRESIVDDADLVLRARGDSRALAGLYERYYARIFRFCKYRLFTTEAAEDVTSEIFLQVAREIRSFSGRTEEDFGNWLYAIATNMTNATIRKTTRRKELLAAAVRSRTFERKNNDSSVHEIEWPTLYQAILQLQPKHQAIIVLRFFEDLTHERMAAILGIKPVTVRVTLSRALRKLRKNLQAASVGDV